MKYIFNSITHKQAEDIAFNWHYEGEYTFYDMEADQEDLEEFLNPLTRGCSVFAVTLDDELVAFLSVNRVADNTYDIGLGMKPELTGKGKGLGFLNAAIEFVTYNYNPEKITLSVATFNQRAIKIYRKIEFKEVCTYMQDTNGSTFEFLKMEYNY